jgi:phosphatidylglycerol lysyltransferase
MARIFRSLAYVIGTRYGAAVRYGLLVVLAAAFLMRSGSELRRAAPMVASADPRWVMAAMASQVVILALITGKYRMLFTRLGAQVNPLIVARAHLRRHLVSTLVPFGGPAGLTRFVRDLGAHQVNAGTVIFASLLATLVNEVAFALFLLPVLGWLAVAGRATGPMVAAVVALGAIVVAGVSGAIAVLRRGKLPANIAARIPARITLSIAEARMHDIRAVDVAAAVPFALAVNVAGVAILVASLGAVGQHPTMTTILAARVVASLVGLLIPVFHGAGAVEATVVGTLHAGGVPVPDALAAIVLYRLAQFWLPLSMGVLAHLPPCRLRIPLRRTTACG